ncbi:MAG TPA: hypothetical protein VE978_03545 [Chitinophagales bacterium]|nr:hypothetical protein [Chitinophagales bacterium]
MKEIFLVLLSIVLLQSCGKKESAITTSHEQNQTTDSTIQNETIDYFIGSSYISHIAVGGCDGGIPPNSDISPDSLFVVYYPDDSMQLNANNCSWMYPTNESGYYSGSGEIPTLVLTNDSAFLDVLIATSYCPIWTGSNWGYNQVWTIYNFCGKKKD